MLLLAAIAGAMLFAQPLLAANPTYEENLNAGDPGWRADGRLAFPPNFDAIGYIKGYASATSVNNGESLSLYVSVNNGTDNLYSISIYRLGYYQGVGGRLMMTFPSSGFAQGFEQPPCSINVGPPAGDGSSVQLGGVLRAHGAAELDQRHLRGQVETEDSCRQRP